MNKNVLSLSFYTVLLLVLGIYRLTRRYGGDASDVINGILLLAGAIYFFMNKPDMKRLRNMYIVLGFLLVFNISLIFAISEFTITTAWFYCYIVLFVCAIGLLVYITYTYYKTKEDVQEQSSSENSRNEDGKYKNLRY